MIANLKPCPTYRQSNVLYADALPSHWELRRLKYVFSRIVGGSTPSSSEADYWDGGVVWVTPTDISKTEHLRTSARRITEHGLRSCSAELVSPGSIIVTSRAPVGNVALAAVELCTNQGCKALVCRPDVILPRFAFALLCNLKDELQSRAKGTTFVEISTSELGIVPIALPPLDEQRAIARYLDHMDHRIRRYIRAKQKLIALLNEQKQAIVHRAITRGLDPNVRLKPSGVEWLGDVPEHWEVFQLRRLVRRGKRITYGIVQPGQPDPVGRFMVRGRDYSSGWGEPETVFRVSDQVEIPYKRSRLSTGDIVLTIVGAGIGNVAIVPAWLDGANITQTTARVSIDPSKADPEFVVAVLEGPFGKWNVELYVKGAAQPGLNLEHVRLFLVPLPPLEEQKVIIARLRDDTGGLRQSIDRAAREIKLLREYRTRLIADMVTGKFDVREAAAALPVEVEEIEPPDERKVPADNEEEAEAADLAAPEEIEA